MKKVFATFLLLAFLTISALAEGETPGGSKSCGGPGQPSCFVQVEDQSGKDDSPVTKTLVIIKSWLTGIFG